MEPASGVCLLPGCPGHRPARAVRRSPRGLHWAGRRHGVARPSSGLWRDPGRIRLARRPTQGPASGSARYASGRIPADGPREFPAPESFAGRLSVHDPAGNLLAGPPLASSAPGVTRRPIVVGGSVVATVSLRPAPPVPSSVETDFLRHQFIGITLLDCLPAWVQPRGGTRTGRLARAPAACHESRYDPNGARRFEARGWTTAARTRSVIWRPISTAWPKAWHAWKAQDAAGLQRSPTSCALR